MSHTQTIHKQFNDSSSESDTKLNHNSTNNINSSTNVKVSKISKISTGKRKYHNKSRKGCSTCKKRRVKCDEHKPICKKCENMGITCGYTVENNDDSDDSSSTPAVPVKTEKDGGEGVRKVMDQIPSVILNAANLGNLSNLGNLGNLGNLSNLGNLGNLSNLASLGNLGNLGNLEALGLGGLGNLGNLNLSQLGSLTGDLSNLENLSNLINPANFKNENDTVNENQTPSISPNISQPNLSGSPLNGSLPGMQFSYNGGLNLLDLRLMYHYTTEVWPTITKAGISEERIWSTDIPMLAFSYPFLMHSILAFSATHLSRTEKGLDQCVTCHRGDALRLLREAVLDINSENTDALVASALILIMDSLANASFPTSTSPKSLPASAWIFHVKGAATILTAVWPLAETSRFHKFISVDLSDLGDIINKKINLPLSDNSPLSYQNQQSKQYTNLECHDSEIADLYPVEINSPYLITLAYLNKIHKERYKSDFILRVFAFPALLDKGFLTLLMTGDIKAMRIMRSYYKLLRNFTAEMKDKIWFLEGVSNVLPVDVEEYAGGAGGMHMMLDFLGGGPSIVDDDGELSDPTGALTNRLIDPNNLPSDITSNLDIMQGDSGFMNMK